MILSNSADAFTYRDERVYAFLTELLHANPDELDEVGLEPADGTEASDSIVDSDFGKLLHNICAQMDVSSALMRGTIDTSSIEEFNYPFIDYAQVIYSYQTLYYYATGLMVAGGEDLSQMTTARTVSLFALVNHFNFMPISSPSGSPFLRSTIFNGEIVNQLASGLTELLNRDETETDDGSLLAASLMPEGGAINPANMRAALDDLDLVKIISSYLQFQSIEDWNRSVMLGEAPLLPYEANTALLFHYSSPRDMVEVLRTADATRYEGIIEAVYLDDQDEIDADAAAEFGEFIFAPLKCLFLIDFPDIAAPPADYLEGINEIANTVIPFALSRGADPLRNLTSWLESMYRIALPEEAAAPIQTAMESLPPNVNLLFEAPEDWAVSLFDESSNREEYVTKAQEVLDEIVEYGPPAPDGPNPIADLFALVEQTTSAIGEAVNNPTTILEGAIEYVAERPEVAANIRQDVLDTISKGAEKAERNIALSGASAQKSSTAKTVIYTILGVGGAYGLYRLYRKYRG